MKRVVTFVLLSMAFSLSGCATNETIKRLNNEVSNLNNTIERQTSEISNLEEKNRKLEADLNFTKEVKGNLEDEKGDLISTVSSLKTNVRSTVNTVINTLTSDLLSNDNVMDRIGSSAITRNKNDKRKKITLVDRKNPVENAGTIYRTTGYFSGPSEYKVQVVRPVEKDSYVVWESQTIIIPKAGNFHFNFKVPVKVEKGDILGYVFAKEVNVYYALGTGSIGSFEGTAELGSKFSLSKIAGESQKRAYSLAVHGLLGV